MEGPPVLRGATAVAVAAAAGYPVPEGGSEASLTLDPDHRAVADLEGEARQRASILYHEDLADLDPATWADEDDDWLLAVACAYHDKILDEGWGGGRWGTAKTNTAGR